MFSVSCMWVRFALLPEANDNPDLTTGLHNK